MKNYIILIILMINGFIIGQNKIDTDAQFLSFLKKSLASKTVNSEVKNSFYERAWKYWNTHKIAYNLHPKKYKQMIDLFHQNQQKYMEKSTPPLDRFEKSIERFRRFDARNTLPKNPILFVGSSSIVYWETANSFPDLPIINRGFGGASLPEIMHYYDTVIFKHAPKMIFIYCDIDVENGKSPEVAVDAFKGLISKISNDFPKTQILLLSMKPTLIDDFLGKDVRTNKLITNKKLEKYCNQYQNLHFVDITTVMFDKSGQLRSTIFIEDGMHLNSTGYILWDPIIKRKIKELY